MVWRRWSCSSQVPLSDSWNDVSESSGPLAGGMSPVEFADLCQKGPQAVIDRLEVTENQAERLCSAGVSVLREIEELDLAPRALIQLNLGSETQRLWRPYDELSKGQKATAALLLLLVGGNAPGPLVVDQPEHDLDNGLIFQTIVPAMRHEKRQRQFLFASHDPNITVLGDAELIAGLSTEIVGQEIRGHIGARGRLGSIDVSEVREAVEENLEGGRDAFERRRRMYGF